MITKPKKYVIGEHFSEWKKKKFNNRRFIHFPLFYKTEPANFFPVRSSVMLIVVMRADDKRDIWKTAKEILRTHALIEPYSYFRIFVSLFLSLLLAVFFLLNFFQCISDSGSWAHSLISRVYLHNTLMWFNYTMRYTEYWRSFEVACMRAVIETIVCFIFV